MVCILFVWILTAIYVFGRVMSVCIRMYTVWRVYEATVV